MCGIAGSYQLARGKPANGDSIHAALHCLAHRGPDDEGTYAAGRAVLGHRRLSIIDTSAAAHQPFTDEGGRYTIVFNGEAFNFKELRADLEAQGHRFRSQSDTEVALRLYALKGEAFLHDLNGFFALAIHDAERDELLIARDRFGVKPLWYGEQHGQLLFASELRAVEALGASGPIDRHSLAQYFTFHFIPAPYSVLNGLRKLEPGELLRASVAGVVRERWYDLPKAVKRVPPAPDPVTRIQELMDDAVRARLVADVPVGTFLSGGLDSSIVSAIARRHKSDLHTFSIGYADDPFFDESDHAEEVARHIGSQHHTFKLTREDLAENYVRLLDALDEPFADSSALPSFILCERTRRSVTVALSGDGADEVFGGYTRHQAELRLRSPGFAEKAVIALAPLWRALPRSRGNPMANTFRKLDRFARIAHAPEGERWLALASFDPDGDAKLIVPLTDEGDAIRARQRDLTAGLSRMMGLNGVLLADVLTTLPNDMLHKVDLTSMAHGLEVRTPFLDRRVVEFAFSLPPELKVRRGQGKVLLRQAFGDLLPAAALVRAKHGFEVPLRPLFQGPLGSILDDLLTEEAVRAAGLEWRAVQAIRQRNRPGASGGGEATLHALAVFMAWWKRRAH